MDKVILTGAAALFLAFPVSSAAQDQMVVRGDETADQVWMAAVGDQLDDRLSSGPARVGLQVPIGAAQIRFRRGIDGRPTDVRLVQRNGDRVFRSHAVRAVAGMQALPALPPTRDGNSDVVANIVIANSPDEFRMLERRVRQWEDQRIASAKAERTTLALTMRGAAYRPN